jgi:hypothetical protein
MRALPIIILALCAAATASAQEIQWPPEGSPVCTANGDQRGLAGTVRGRGFVWLTHAAADTVRSAGMGLAPPTGDCGPANMTFAGELLESTFASAELVQPFLLGCPCSAPPNLAANTWIGHAGASDQVVVNFPDFYDFFPTAPVIARTTGAGTISSCTIAGNGPWPYFAPDSTVMVAWSESAPVPQILAQRLNTHGPALMWNGGDPVVVAPTGTPQLSPRALRLFDGSSLVAWLEDRGSGVDVYAMRIMADGTRAAGWPATGLALEARSETSSELHVVEVSPGQPPFVVWQETGARFAGGSSIVARRLLGDGLPDPAWSDSGLVLTSSRTVDRLEDVQPTTILWSDSRAATAANPTDLYARQFANDFGAPSPGWSAAGVALCTAPGRQDHARTDGNLYAWEDLRSGVPKVYATERASNGALPCCVWLPDGNPVATADGEQRNPIVDSGHVAWEDSRNLATTGIDIYGQIFYYDGRNVDAPAPATPSVATLRAPWPNPARSATRLRLELPRASNVRLAVYDVLGRHVNTLANAALSSGPHEWSWPGVDDAGHRLPAGLYHVHAVIDGVAQTKSIVLVR